MDKQRHSDARAIWNRIKPASSVRENIWLGMNWTPNSPAGPQWISVGWVMRLLHSVAPCTTQKSPANSWWEPPIWGWLEEFRLLFLLSGSSNLKEVLILMGIMMEDARQVSLTACMFPVCSGKHLCLLLRLPEWQITFNLHRYRLPWSTGSPSVGLPKARKTYPPVKSGSLFHTGTHTLQHN